MNTRHMSRLKLSVHACAEGPAIDQAKQRHAETGGSLTVHSTGLLSSLALY